MNIYRLVIIYSHQSNTIKKLLTVNFLTDGITGVIHHILSAISHSAKDPATRIVIDGHFNPRESGSGRLANWFDLQPKEAEL